MRKFFGVVVCLVGALTGCKPDAPGPFFTLVALERWHRADPATEHTMTGTATYRRDEREPFWKVLDEFCGVAYGNWSEASEQPPSFGTIRMQIADRQEVSWPRDVNGESGWEDPKGALAWDTGDRLHVVAPGDEAPAFEIDAVVPAQIELTSHDFRSMAANQFHVSRAEPLELRWNPTTGDVLVLILQFRSNNSLLRRRMMWCVYPAAPGAVSMSPEVLGHLLPSTNGLSTNIYVGGATRQKQALEGVDLEAFTFKNEAARI